MSLKEAIRFRDLSSELDEGEMHEFLVQMVDEQPKILLIALFDHFKRDNAPMAKESSKRVTRIIQARDNYHSHAYCDLLNIGNFPSPVISNMVQFMQQSDYSNFTKLNRNIFIGCHEPNTLPEIYFNSDINCNKFPFNWRLFPAISRLELDLAQIHKRLNEVKHTDFLQQLRCIYLEGNDCHNDDDVDYFVTDFPRVFSIKELKLSWLGNDICSKPNFLSILRKFPNTQYLSLSNVANCDSQKIYQLLPTLKGLSITSLYMDENQKRLLHVFGKKLEYLAIDFRQIRRDYELNVINFAILTQLKVKGANMKCINNIITSAIKLQQLSISAIAMNLDLTIEDAMRNIIVTAQSLHYVRVCDSYNQKVTHALSGIERGLKETKNIKRECFQVEIEIPANSSHADNPSDLVLPVTKIVHQFLKCNIDNWLLVWRVNGRGNFMEQIRQQFANKFSLAVHVQISHNTVGIMSKYCTIHGYREPWKIIM